MSNAKLAAFAAALVMAVAANASAQTAQPVHAALKAPRHMTRPQLVSWCKSHPAATADCKEVRTDTREVRADRKEVRADRAGGEDARQSAVDPLDDG